MSLRARLTLIYGFLLAVVFVGLGLGAEIVMQGRFSDQARGSLIKAASQAEVNYRIHQVGQDKNYYQYLLPLKQQPFAGVYLELVNAFSDPVDTSANLQPSHLPIDASALSDALNGQATFVQRTWEHNQLELYYTPMPNPLPIFSLARVEPAALVVAKSQSDVFHALDVFNAALFSGEAFVWLLAVVVTWLVSGSALRPITAITERAAANAETSDFSGRVPVDNRTAELRRLGMTFNLMLDSLQQAYANQQRFLADASHELRTPLTVLQGNLHYLEEAPDAPVDERHEALHAARLEADRMGSLVGDLLALSHADAGLGIQHDPLELDRVVIDAFRRIQARERSLHGEMRVQMRLGRLDEVVVDGDPERLLQLVVILLDNAAKYTPAGGAVEVELVGGLDGHATVCVADTGPGVLAEDRDHIFERFYRARSSQASAEGSGLGLPIAKWIAEAHGGSISFENRPGGGARFVVTLPARMSQPMMGWE